MKRESNQVYEHNFIEKFKPDEISRWMIKRSSCWFMSELFYAERKITLPHSAFSNKILQFLSRYFFGNQGKLLSRHIVDACQHSLVVKIINKTKVF